MRRVLILSVLLLGLVAYNARPCFAQLMNSSWPGFRHDAQHTGRCSLVGPSSGTLGWSRQIGGAMSSPAIGPDAIYVLADGDLIAMSFAGDQLWSYPCGSGSRSSPAVASNGTIYVACDSWLYAINPNGSLKWKKLLPGPSEASPTVGPDGSVYIGCSQGKFQAYTSAGGPRYTFTTNRSISSSAALATDGTAYFGCDDGCLYAVKTDGTLKWKFTTSPLGGIQASPAVGPDGTIYFGTMSGFFFAVSSTGTQKWRTAAGVSTSSPAIASDGTIYFGCQDRSLYALSKVGALKWKYTTQGSIHSSPAVDSNGAVYFGSDDGSLYAVSVGGALLWEYQSGAAIASSPAIGESQSLYILVADGTLRRVSADATPPTAPVVTDDGVYSTSQSALHASWSASDPESGISRYEYAIGTTPGAQDLLPFSDAGAATEVTHGGLALANGARYYFAVRAINGAGLVGDVGVSDGIIVDYTSPETPSVTDDGAFSTLQSRLHASWTSADPESGVVRYEYAIGTTPEGEDLVPFTDSGTAREITRDDLTLANGARYYVSVRATNAAGLASYLGVSDGITVDFTPPQTPVVVDDGKFTTSPDTLHFAYGSGDTESGIEHYEYSIGTSPGAEDALNWQSAGLLRELTIDSLSLLQGLTYFINVRAYNHAGLVTMGSSNGILVDRTPPPLPGIEILSATISEIHFRVVASDPESGIEQTQYAVLRSPDPSAAVWIDCQPASEIVGTGQFSGSTYYIAARARNGAGLWSDVATQQATADATPPTTPVVQDDGVYSTSPTTLSAVWTSQDPETGIARYSYCVGTAPGLDDLVGWSNTTDAGVTLSGLSLTNGATYYFSVKATNNAGLTSAVGSSDGITVDTTPATTPVVIDDGDYTSVVDSLHAVFSSADSESRIVEYSYCVGTSAGASDVVGWTSVGTANSVTASGLSLQAGKTYYFGVKARNGAGLWGAVGISDGIEYRLRDSVWPKFHQDSGNAGRSEVNACLSGHQHWRVQTEGYVESSAAYAGDGTVYVGSSDGKLYAISSSGTVRWSYQTGGAIDSSPAIGPGGEVYVGSCDHYLYCIKPSGALQWRFATSGMVWSSPSIGADGTVYFGGQDGWFYAIKPDGLLKWKYNAGVAVWSSPAMASDGTIYFACGNGKLYALTATGSLKWSYQTGTAADSSPSVGGDGAIYFGSGDGYFYAINPSGTLRWRSYTGQLVDSSAAIGPDGVAYVGTGGAGYSGSMRAYSSAGVELWRMTLAGGVRSSPALDARGTLYFGTADGKVYALRSDGSVIWSYAAGQSVLSSPAIGPDGEVIVGADDGGVYCFKDYPEDNTPPTKPVVAAAQYFLPKGTALSCSWSASDPESGIEKYFYAVGTQPGLSDIVNWVDAGIAKSAVRSDLTLTVGQSYYVSVKARNHVGLDSEIGSSGAITIVPDNPINLIGDAKKRPDGTRVYLPGKVVTAVFADCVFIEEPERTSGIRCVVSSSDLQSGAIVDVVGRVSRQNGETVLTDLAFSRLNAAGSVPPVATSIKFATGPGLDISGLLVRLTGRVTKSGAYYFIISDGTKINSPRGVAGIEVRAGVGDIPPVGAYVSVAGAVTREVVNAVPAPVLRAAPGSCLVILP